MTLRDGTRASQASFLDTLLLGSETERTSTELSVITPILQDSSQPSNLLATHEEIADLFGFISAVKQLGAKTAAINAKEHIQESEIRIAEQKEHRRTPEWILENCPEQVTRIVAILNLMQDCERMPPLELAEKVFAPQLVRWLDEQRFSDIDRKQALLNCVCNLENFALSLYGDVKSRIGGEISRCVDTLLGSMSHQPYEDENIWIHQAMEVAVRKTLAEQCQSMYTAFVLSTIQRPIREVVHTWLAANQLPFPERVLAQVRERGYAKTIRESLQTLARLGFTAHTMTLAWEAIQSSQTDTKSPWIAQRADGHSAVILKGHAILESRVVRSLDYAILAMFDPTRRITRQITIEISSIEEAKQSLWTQGYRHGEGGFPPADRVVKLWSDFCRPRDNGWWFGDEAGRVMVVIPYVLKSRLGYHKSLCHAVAQMQAWGYDFRYDQHTLYFIPEGVSLPACASDHRRASEA